MSPTYFQVIGAMEAVKTNTLALQAHKITLSAYKSSIISAKKQFTEAHSFVENNPPGRETLNPYYQEFLAGIILANQSMDVVLNGIASFNPVSLYTARDMGSRPGIK